MIVVFKKLESRTVSEVKSGFDKVTCDDEKLRHVCLLGLLEDV